MLTKEALSEALAIAARHHEAGRLGEAEQIYTQILAIDPQDVDALHLLGVIASQTDRHELAVVYISRAIELNGTDAGFHNNLGNAFRAQGKLNAAVASYTRALDLKPDFAEAHCNLGNALQSQGKLEDAIASFRRALELKPEYAEAHNDLGNARYVQGRLDEAVAFYQQALVLKPNYAVSHYNLGTVLQDQGMLDEAVAHFQRALELKPDYAEAHNNLSLLLLQRGDFERGWPEREWRWKCKELEAGALARPPWDGTHVKAAILLHTDQGLGDTLQFIRYAPLVRQRAGEVLLRCPRKLIPLLHRCPGIDQLIPDDVQPPACDAEAHLTSLPAVFCTRIETVPREVPYLFADPQLVEQWRSRLPTAELKVGIAWQGSPGFKQDKTRSIRLVEFAPLAEVDGVRLVSLQKGHGIEQLAGVKHHFSVMELPSDMDESTGAFSDTAAVMMNLDLVITSDTAIAHLAGGLGVPVWVALSYLPEWRWLLDRSDSPWYPTMRLFRQTSAGNWPGVFENMNTALRDRLLKRRAT